MFTAMVSSAVATSVQQANDPILSTLAMLQQQLTARSTNIDQQVMATLRPQLDAMQREFQAQNDALNHRIDDNERTLENHAAQLADLQDQIRLLREQTETDRKMPARPPAPFMSLRGICKGGVL